MHKHRWGSDEWITDYARRTYVEAGFGEFRNPALGALARGTFCVIGIIKVTFMLAAASPHPTHAASSTGPAPKVFQQRRPKSRDIGNIRH